MTKDHFIPVSHQKHFSLPLQTKKSSKFIRYGRIIIKTEEQIKIGWSTTRDFGFRKNLNSGITMPNLNIPFESFLSIHFDILPNNLNKMWQDIDQHLDYSNNKYQFRSTIQFNDIAMIGNIMMYIFTHIIRHPDMISALGKERRNYFLGFMEDYVDIGYIYKAMPNIFGIMYLPERTGILFQNTLPVVLFEDNPIAYIPFKPDTVVILSLDPHFQISHMSLENHKENYLSILNGSTYFNTVKSNYHKEVYFAHPDSSLEIIQEMIFPPEFISRQLPTVNYLKEPDWLDLHYRR